MWETEGSSETCWLQALLGGVQAGAGLVGGWEGAVSTLREVALGFAGT